VRKSTMQTRQITVLISGRQTATLQTEATTWNAPKVGQVRSESDVSPSQERIVDELVSFEY